MHYQHQTCCLPRVWCTWTHGNDTDRLALSESKAKSSSVELKPPFLSVARVNLQARTPESNQFNLANVCRGDFHCILGNRASNIGIPRKTKELDLGICEFIPDTHNRRKLRQDTKTLKSLILKKISDTSSIGFQEKSVGLSSSASRIMA